METSETNSCHLTSLPRWGRRRSSGSTHLVFLKKTASIPRILAPKGRMSCQLHLTILSRKVSRSIVPDVVYNRYRFASCHWDENGDSFQLSLYFEPNSRSSFPHLHSGCGCDRKKERGKDTDGNVKKIFDVTALIDMHCIGGGEGKGEILRARRTSKLAAAAVESEECFAHMTTSATAAASATMFRVRAPPCVATGEPSSSIFSPRPPAGCVDGWIEGWKDVRRGYHRVRRTRQQIEQNEPWRPLVAGFAAHFSSHASFPPFIRPLFFPPIRNARIC